MDTLYSVHPISILGPAAVRYVDALAREAGLPSVEDSLWVLAVSLPQLAIDGKCECQSCRTTGGQDA